MSTELMSRFLEGLHASRLLDRDRIEELLRRPETQQGDMDGVAKYLESNGRLTRFQINEILDGRGESLMFAGYRLLERLPDSASGPAFRAFHPALQQAVVVRWLNADWIGPVDDLRSYLERAQASSLLSHPHVLSTLDAGMVGDTPFLVQEGLDGADLGLLVDEMGALPVSLACEYSRQAATALQAGYDRGLLHGDFAPSRMILAPIVRKLGVNGSGHPVSIRPAPGATIKVAEMGLCPRRPAIGAMSFLQTNLLGEVHYLAPERLTQPDQSVRGDLYSLGATIYFLLAARPPFPAKTVAEALTQLQHDQPARIDSLRNDIPAALGEFIHRLLAKNPDQRPASAAEAARVLQSFGKPPSAVASRPAAVPVADATLSIPNALPAVMAAQPQLQPLIEPLSDSQKLLAGVPLVEALPENTSDSQVYSPRKVRANNALHAEESHHDLFGHHHGDDATPAPRKREELKGGWKWLIIGGCLHLLAIAALVMFFLKVGPFSESSSTEEEKPTVKEQKHEKPSKKRK